MGVKTTRMVVVLVIMLLKILAAVIVLTTTPVMAKDYFGFNFDEDTPVRVCNKAEIVFADCEPLPDGRILVRGNGLLSLAADWLNDANITFNADAKIEEILVRTHVLDVDERIRLLKHLQEDYDLDALKTLNNVRLTDIRGYIWSIDLLCKTNDACQYDVAVKRQH